MFSGRRGVLIMLLPSGWTDPAIQRLMHARASRRTYGNITPLLRWHKAGITRPGANLSLLGGLADADQIIQNGVGGREQSRLESFPPPPRSHRRLRMTLDGRRTAQTGSHRYGLSDI